MKHLCNIFVTSPSYLCNVVHLIHLLQKNFLIDLNHHFSLTWNLFYKHWLCTKASLILYVVYQIYKTENKFSFNLINHRDAYSKLGDPSLLHLSADLIARLITLICNLTLSTANFFLNMESCTGLTTR